MRNDEELNARAVDIYNYIVEYYAQRRYPPTIREIGAAVGLKSTSNVHTYLKLLEKKGYIRMDASRQRTISVVQSEAREDELDLVSVPVIGAVAAGSPILAFDDVRGYMPIARDMLHGGGSDVFILDVEGQSMIQAGIHDGDRILVHRGLAVNNGEIGVARVSSVYGDAATVKRIYYEGKSVRLQPENDAMSPIIVPADGVEIVGKVIGLYREY